MRILTRLVVAFAGLLILCGNSLAQERAALNLIPLLRPATLAAEDIPTLKPEQTIGLALDADVAAFVRRNAPDRFVLPLPAIGGNRVELKLERYESYRGPIRLGRTTADGFKESDYVPGVVSYRVRNKELSGVVILTPSGVFAAIRKGQRQFELSPVAGNKEGMHVCFEVADLASPLSFACGTEDMAVRAMGMPPQTRNSSQILECIEVALDIDYFTYTQFGSDCIAAADWALAMLAAVDGIYRTELDDLVTLSATFIHVWETTDPYAAVTNDGGGLLDVFRNEWLTNPNFTGVQRDITHYLTRRSNTGTGGIAYLDVVCYETYSYGLSSALTSATDYTGGYAWNLNVLAHELGHNLGSNHTQWCGWSTGPIDNCAAYEGDELCNGYTSNPTPQVGTIMSYCHAIAGGSVVLQFHPTVENEGLIPAITAGIGNCFGDCAPFESSCEVYGCTDPTACNYDPAAVVDNGSCAEIDLCGDCDGGNAACSGCTDEAACNYDAEATISADVCTYPPAGVTCDCASTVSLVATLSAGQTATTSLPNHTGNLATVGITMVFDNSTSTGTWPADQILRIDAPNGNCYEVGGYNDNLGCSNATTFPSSWATSNPGTYTTTLAISGDLSGEGEWTFTLANGWTGSGPVNLDVTLTPSYLCEVPADVPGCTDLLACNYNPEATSDDGSCEYASCAPTCPGDIDGDGLIAVSDILVLLGDFGCVIPAEPECPGDANNDGTTNVNDLLVILSSFGDSCE